MKLFQRLLVAPAALGLLSPLSATATEVNLDDISKIENNVQFASICGLITCCGEGAIEQQPEEKSVYKFLEDFGS